MQNQNRNLLLTLLAGVLVGGGVFLLYRSQVSVPGTETATSTPIVSGLSTTTTKDGVTFVSGNGTVEQVPVSGNSQVSSNASVQALVVKARDQKNAGNYTGAIATLNQAAALAPNDVVVNNNLGDIYMNFQKDYVKADVSYKKVIATDPRYLDAYRHLFELYTATSYKPSNTAAADIVAAAVKADPKAYDLQVLLARYYRDSGRTAEARVQYQTAVANAQGQNLASVAANIQAELNALPQ